MSSVIIIPVHKVVVINSDDVTTRLLPCIKLEPYSVHTDKVILQAQWSIILGIDFYEIHPLYDRWGNVEAFSFSGFYDTCVRICELLDIKITEIV